MVYVVSLALAVLAAPFFFGGEPLIVAPAVSLLLYCLLFCRPQSIFEIRRLPQLSLLCCSPVLIWIAIQSTGFSSFPLATRLQFFVWLSCGVLFCLCQGLSKEQVQQLLGAIALLGLLEAIYGMFQVRQNPEWVLWKLKERHLHYATGTYLNRNHLAGLLEMALGVQVGFLIHCWSQKLKLHSLLWGVVLLATAAGFVQTGSRMGILSFMISFGLFLILMNKNRKITAVVFLMLALFSFAAVIGIGKQALFVRFEEVYQGFETWDEGRLTAWRDAWQATRHYFLGGSGLGTFAWIFPHYQSGQLLLGWNHAHNDYLELLLELGAPAFILWISGWMIYGVFCIQQLRRHSSFLGWGCMIGMTAVVFHGMTDYNFAVFGNLLVWFALCGLSFSLLRNSYGMGD